MPQYTLIRELDGLRTPREEIREANIQKHRALRKTILVLVRKPDELFARTGGSWYVLSADQDVAEFKSAFLGHDFTFFTLEGAIVIAQPEPSALAVFKDWISDILRGW